MRNALAIILVLIAGAAGCGQPTQSADRAVNERDMVLQLERDWAEAYKNRDREALGKVLTEEFIFTDDEGRVSKKPEYIDAVMSLIRVESYTLHDVDARLSGDTAVVTGLWSGKTTTNGVDASGDFRFTDTFIRRQGRWQVLASHDSRVVETHE